MVIVDIAHIVVTPGFNASPAPEALSIAAACRTGPSPFRSSSLATPTLDCRWPSVPQRRPGECGGAQRLFAANDPRLITASSAIGTLLLAVLYRQRNRIEKLKE